jgi:hypothetical protein
MHAIDHLDVETGPENQAPIVTGSMDTFPLVVGLGFKVHFLLAWRRFLRKRPRRKFLRHGFLFGANPRFDPHCF